MREATLSSREKNASFFHEHHAEYLGRLRRLRTYKNIFDVITGAIAGADRLLDIGNGGIFEYDTAAARRIVAVDIAFTPQFRCDVPTNAETKYGSATDLPVASGSADMVLINMLLHHLTGETVAASLGNVSLALSEASRVLRSGGKIVVMESCVPAWFYALEKAAYRASSRVIDRLLAHPPTLQFPARTIELLLSNEFGSVSRKRIRMGAWVLQFGRYWPSILTPARPYLFVGIKR